jgi:hypothetical protein
LTGGGSAGWKRGKLHLWDGCGTGCSEERPLELAAQLPVMFSGGVETLRTGLVQPLIDEGHQVAITLTPTAVWLDHLGEVRGLGF